MHKYLPSSMKVWVSDRQKHNSRSEASFFCSKTQKNHRNGFQNKLVLSSLSSFWPFCFSLFLSVCVSAAEGPTRLCGHYCKSTLTRCWLRLGGRVWNVARLLPFFFFLPAAGTATVSYVLFLCVCANQISPALLWIPNHYYASGRSVPLCLRDFTQRVSSLGKCTGPGLRHTQSQWRSPKPCRLLVTKLPGLNSFILFPLKLNWKKKKKQKQSSLVCHITVGHHAAATESHCIDTGAHFPA